MRLCVSFFVAEQWSSLNFFYTQTYKKPVNFYLLPLRLPSSVHFTTIGFHLSLSQPIHNVPILAVVT